MGEITKALFPIIDEDMIKILNGKGLIIALPGISEKKLEEFGPGTDLELYLRDDLNSINSKRTSPNAVNRGIWFSKTGQLNVKHVAMHSYQFILPEGIGIASPFSGRVLNVYRGDYASGQWHHNHNNAWIVSIIDDKTGLEAKISHINPCVDAGDLVSEGRKLGMALRNPDAHEHIHLDFIKRDQPTRVELYVSSKIQGLRRPRSRKRNRRY